MTNNSDCPANGSATATPRSSVELSTLLPHDHAEFTPRSTVITSRTHSFVWDSYDNAGPDVFWPSQRIVAAAQMRSRHTTDAR